MNDSSTRQHFATHLSINVSNRNAVELLADKTELSRQTIKDAMQKGAVWLTQNNQTQRLRRAKKPLAAGSSLHLYFDQTILATEPLPAQLIADEQAYSVWYKPYGMYCQGSKWGDHCTINRWIEHHTQRPTFIVHRLDRAATGLIVIAHQKRTAAALATLFEQRKVEKRYRVIVQGQFPVDKISTTFNQHIEGRSAISHVKPMDYNSQCRQSLLEVSIETGRKHQIRRHLSAAGYPVVGDRLYGNSDKEQDLQLCSCYLAFTCPLTGQDKAYTLDQPLQPAL